VQPTPTSAHHGSTPPGWYADPWKVAEWRWWDGRMWTAHVEHGRKRRPRLPDWLSVPIVLCALPVVLATVWFIVDSPLSVALSLVPLAIVLPTLWWLDRVEPEPRSALLHSLLWGATVAVLISGSVNTVVAELYSFDTAAVVSAPLVEEATKGLGVYWMVRRGHVDSVLDGVIYAGWVAIGFAVVEDIQYFASAEAVDQLLPVFIVRGIVTPFAHPLFTFWIGLAAGLAKERGLPVGAAMGGGYLVAVLTHAAWNGSLSVSESSGGAAVILVAIVGFLLLFGTVVGLLIRFRQRERRQFLAVAPMLVQRYGLTPAELEIFSDWGRMLAVRRSLPRAKRRTFDGVHAALARLAILHSSPPADPTDEARLVNLLYEARASAR
jgi:RsiW-degrading membrane proteinase PrsW (M82 family)